MGVGDLDSILEGHKGGDVHPIEENGSEGRQQIRQFVTNPSVKAQQHCRRQDTRHRCAESDPRRSGDSRPQDQAGSGHGFDHAKGSEGGAGHLQVASTSRHGMGVEVPAET